MAKDYAREFGVSLREAELRLAVQQHAAPLVASLEASLGSRFAGIWFDNSTGRFEIPVTAPSAQEPALQAAASDSLAGSVDVVNVKSSLAELQRNLTDLNEELAKLGYFGAGGVSTGLDIQDNALILRESTTATPEATAIIKALVSRLAVSVAVTQVSGPIVGHTTDGCYSFPPKYFDGNEHTEVYCEKPLRGGVTIYSEPQNGFIHICSAGFVSKYSGSSQQYLYTAGHCMRAAGLGSKWYSRPLSGASREIGTDYGYREDWSGDYGDIAINGGGFWGGVSPGNWVADLRPGGLGIEAPMLYLASNYPGLYNCRTGGTTGTSCGQIISIGNSYLFEEGYTVGSLVLDSFCDAKGDSGGAVWGPNYAFGLTQGYVNESGCGADTYTDINKALEGTGGLTPIL